MRHVVLLVASLITSAAVGCSSSEETTPTEQPAPPREREELPAPGPLVAGVAETRLPAPVGIGTMGYGSVNAKAKSVTPFAEMYPGTTRQHGAPMLKAVALSRGPAYEVVIVRSDTIGVFEQLREAVIERVKADTGRDLSASLVIGANHTHSGPGRLLYTDGPLKAAADSFLPEHYERVVAAFVKVVEDALADQKPAEIGHVVSSLPDAHNDRRCNNDLLPQKQEDPSMPIVAIRRAGAIDALIVSYAYHGTILGIDDLTLSGDMGAAVEQAISERFDKPVSVLFLNSWGADMSPGSAKIDASAVGAELPGGYDRMDYLASKIADVVGHAAATIAFDGNADVRARSYRVPLERAVMGYDEETFSKYPNGGLFCGLSGEGLCNEVRRLESLDDFCVGLGPDDLRKQTLLVAGTIGKLHFVTGPGEWSTNLATGVLDRVKGKAGGDAMFIGYANDYTGYSLNEPDWWQGGYETGGALWGPKQGDYLAARSFEVFETFFDKYKTPPFEERGRLAPFSGYTVTPYAAEASIDAGQVATDVAPTPAATDIVKVTMLGGDPWLGTPVATLERETATPGTFTPVTRKNGTLMTSDGYEFWVDLAPTPAYADNRGPVARRFAWTFNLPLKKKTGFALGAGRYRFSAQLPTTTGQVTATSGTFTVP